VLARDRANQDFLFGGLFAQIVRVRLTFSSGVLPIRPTCHSNDSWPMFHKVGCVLTPDKMLEMCEISCFSILREKELIIHSEAVLLAQSGNM